MSRILHEFVEALRKAGDRQWLYDLEARRRARRSASVTDDPQAHEGCVELLRDQEPGRKPRGHE